MFPPHCLMYDVELRLLTRATCVTLFFFLAVEIEMPTRSCNISEVTFSEDEKKYNKNDDMYSTLLGPSIFANW